MNEIEISDNIGEYYFNFVKVHYVHSWSNRSTIFNALTNGRLIKMQDRFLWDCPTSETTFLKANLVNNSIDKIFSKRKYQNQVFFIHDNYDIHDGCLQPALWTVDALCLENNDSNQEWYASSGLGWYDFKILGQPVLGNVLRLRMKT